MVMACGVTKACVSVTISPGGEATDLIKDLFITMFLLLIQCPAHGPPGRAGPFACAQLVNELALGPAQGLCYAPTTNAVEILLRHNFAQFNFVEGSEEYGYT